MTKIGWKLACRNTIEEILAEAVRAFETLAIRR
jgi:hypothetical protein